MIFFHKKISFKSRILKINVTDEVNKFPSLEKDGCPQGRVVDAFMIQERSAYTTTALPLLF